MSVLARSPPRVVSVMLLTAVLLPGTPVLAQSPPPEPPYDGYSGGGRGYLIDDIEDLKWLSHIVLNRVANDYPGWNQRFLANLRATLTADIDASATRYWDYTDDNGDGHPFNDPNDYTDAGLNNGFVPIGAANMPFKGVFDGGGFTISNLYIQGDFDHRYQPGIGFFGVAEEAQIENLRLVGADVTGEVDTGILVGSVGGGTQIRNVHTAGTVRSGTSDQYSNFGGIAGQLAGGSVLESSHSAATVLGTAAVGGLVGYNNVSTVRDAYFTGQASAANRSLGGVAGQSTGSLLRTYSIGRLTATTDTLTGMGPVVGDLYSVGQALVGNFWNADSSGALDQGGVSGFTGITTRQMIDFATFRDAGWDFVTETANGTADRWDMDQGDSLNAGFPILAWQAGADSVLQHFDGGRGTPDNPFRIATLQNLQQLAFESRFRGAIFVQTADIDASPTATWDDVDTDGDGNPVNDPTDATSDGNNEGFRPIGTAAAPFTGTYRGGGHTIRGLTISRPGVNGVGLFGHLNGATIDSLGLDRIRLFGADSTGAIAGSAAGSTLSRSFARGDVLGLNKVGGLFGESTDLTLTDVYTVTRVTALSDAGSLAGRATNPTVTNAYAGGTVAPLGSGGGGGLGRSTYDAPAAAPVPGLGALIGTPTGGTFTASYWNADGDPTPGGAQGTAVPAVGLAETATFTSEAPWDFAGDPGDDTSGENIWDMDQLALVNGGLPILSWQAGADSSPYAFPGTGTPDDPFLIASLTDLARPLPSCRRYRGPFRSSAGSLGPGSRSARRLRPGS